MLKWKLSRRPIQEIAPWATMVTPELVLDKDGSLLTVFTFEGVDADSPNAARIWSSNAPYSASASIELMATQR